MTFYRSRVAASGLARQQPNYRTAAAVATRTFSGHHKQLGVSDEGISSDVPGASVVVSQTGPDHVVISEVVNGETTDAVSLPIVTVPAEE